MTASLRLHFTAADTPPAQAALRRLTARYGQAPAGRAEVLVALGGDGFLLQTMHGHYRRQVPIYGMRRGSVGFLLNDYQIGRLTERIRAAQPVPLRPLRMIATGEDGRRVTAIAFNEVHVLRSTWQATHLAISVDGVTRLSQLVCDGVLLATPAGSTAYNLSAHGPIIPLHAPALALTPISAFRPRRWRGAILPAGARVGLRVLDRNKRPANAYADFTEVRGLRQLQVSEARDISVSLLFDPDHSLEERIMREQFAV